MNEEEIRGKILLPFLNDLGFDLSEISLENSFSIRLGKSQHTIKGRSDILCKRNGKNLFIIELKNDMISITQNDIDQGISYATALTDNIAPFTIITNGKTTKIFDSVSRIELTGKNISEQSSFWKNGYTLSTDEELRIRFEALKKFVSFSSKNLEIFCKNQVQDRMGPIIGSIDAPSAKFVKELHVQRKDLLESFSNFINSEASVFGIVGSAGVGKTSAMCSLALQNLNEKFVFFYNAALINKSPIEHIAQDLNVVFSSKNESDLVLKKLDELGRFLNKSILIFIDAIDESINTNVSLELSEMALACRNLDRIKICISCKSSIWKNILKINDTKNYLFEELNKFHDLIESADNCPGFLLTDFNDEELKDIIPLYESTYGFKGQASESLLNELRNGFFLKIFSEVYNHREIPERINDKDLIKKYINQSLEKTNLGVQSGLRILSKIGKILINQNYKYNLWEALNDEGLEVIDLLEKLDLSLDETLPKDLFARNILVKSNKEDSYNISFYYSKIRDYIICFHSYKLDKLTDDEFYNVLSEFYQNYIGQSAITFYIESASYTHKNTLIKFKKDKALKYVTDYNLYLEDNFKNCKKLFDPKTVGDIGIMLLPRDILKEDGYALFPIDSNTSDRIRYESLEGVFSGSSGRDFFQKNRINVVHGTNVSLLIPNQGNVISQNIFEQLKDIILKGKLNTYNSDILLMEQVSTILYYYSQKLGYNFKIQDLYLPRFETLYPINLNELRYRIYKFRAIHFFKRNQVPPSQLNQMAEDAFEKNIDIPSINITGDFPPFEELFKIVNILLQRGYNEINKHYLPYPDKSITEIEKVYKQNRMLDLSQIRCTQYSVNQALLYIESFFRHLESCYQEFADYFFPTFKDKFTFLNTLPHEYFFYMEDSNILKNGMFGYRTSKCGKMSIQVKEYKPLGKIFEDGEVTSLKGFSLDRVLINDSFNPIKTVSEINTPQVDSFSIIRHWVYELLRDDMRALFRENGENI